MLADNVPAIIAIMLALLLIYTAVCVYFGNDM